VRLRRSAASPLRLTPVERPLVGFVRGEGSSWAVAGCAYCVTVYAWPHNQDSHLAAHAAVNAQVSGAFWAYISMATPGLRRSLGMSGSSEGNPQGGRGRAGSRARRRVAVYWLAVMPWEHTGSKIAARHRERLAMVYVRQSTRQQVVGHQESTRLQYKQPGGPARRLDKAAGGKGWHPAESRLETY
jgi:hypothetical protein